ncbi:MAG TPA: DUF1003 domain-containing protein [Dehalococcoidia bacterium]|nr:DUF1003 domain-containing protein [Dehalococcoidia bacterium]
MSAESGRLAGHGRRARAMESPRIARSVRQIARLEDRARVEMGPADHVANGIAAFSGSMLFVGLHVAWYATWILVNTGKLGVAAFDPYPFTFLLMTTNLEAIFLATFVLMSQNRQAVQSDRRARIDLEMSTIAEQEVTKLIEMVRDIHERLGMQREDPDLAAMQEPTYIEELGEQVDELARRAGQEDAEPDSAIDTEA